MVRARAIASTRADAPRTSSARVDARRFASRGGCGGARARLATAFASDAMPFELAMERVDVGNGLSIRIARPADEDAVVDHYVELGKLDADPYWATLWPSAFAAARYLVDAPALVRDKTVYDLGAGLGLAGLAACAAGARRVVLLDREPLALACAELSIRANGFEGRVTTQVFDWNAVDEGQEKFDTLLACDVLYEASAVAPVAELVPKLVRGGGGRFFIGDPPLRAPKNRARFKSLLTEQYGAFVMRELTVMEGSESLILIDFKL